MKLLLDTNVLYWWMTGEDLNPVVAGAISEPSNHVAISVASVWELAIKAAKGKLLLNVDVVETLAAARLEVLPIEVDAALAVRDLPHHHRDPFDRLIIAQARIDGYTVITSDEVFKRYDVEILAA